MPRNQWIVTYRRKDAAGHARQEFTRWSEAAAFIKYLLLQGYVATVEHGFAPPPATKDEKG